MAQTKIFKADISVSISDFDTDDIIDYLQDEAFMNEEQLNRIREFVGDRLDSHQGLKPDTLTDVMKIEVFREAIGKYTIIELEQRLS